MLKEAVGISKIYVACGFTDLRMGIDGLAALVQEQFQLNPLDKGTLFLFCGRRSDRIKGLLFEGDGYLVLTKRLSWGFYQWPRDSTEARQIDMNAFLRLMDGFQVDSSIRRIARIPSCE